MYGLSKEKEIILATTTLHQIPPHTTILPCLLHLPMSKQKEPTEKRVLRQVINNNNINQQGQKHSRLYFSPSGSSLFSFGPPLFPCLFPFPFSSLPFFSSVPPSIYAHMHLCHFHFTVALFWISLLLFCALSFFYLSNCNTHRSGELFVNCELASTRQTDERGGANKPGQVPISFGL